MAFTLQGVGPILHWITLVILFVLPVLGALILYKLGSLPGSIARARHHPQAEAIGICGWMGIITLVLWPIAMVWAHLRPAKSVTGDALSEVDAASVLDHLQKASQRIGAIEAKLPTRPAGKGA